MTPDLTKNLTAIDKTIMYFSPEMGLRRAAARNAIHAFGYNDDPTRRGRSGGKGANAASESWVKNRDRYKAMWDARDLCAHDWLGGVLGKVGLYVCGSVSAKSETDDDQVNSAYDSYFYNWCGDDRDEVGGTRCDITGRHRFSKLVQMAFLAHLVDGDCALIEVAAQESPTAQMDEMGEYIPGTGSYCLQSVEADRIGSPDDSSTLENYIGGFSIDPINGRVLSARIFDRSRTGQYTNPREIEMANFIHVFDPDRSDEYRGRTALLRVLNDCRDIREIFDAEKLAQKIQAQYTALVGSKDPYNGTGANSFERKPGTDPKSTPTQDAEWGKILRMAEGESFSMLAPSSRPSGAFLAFVQIILRKMAQALKLPYGFLWDLTQLGGVNSRIEVQGALRQIQYWQENVLVNRILNRVREKVIAEGIATRQLPPHPLWKQCSWNFGPYISTDAGYEMDSDIAGITHGIIPIEGVTGKYGKTPKEVFTANARTANQALLSGAEQQLPVEAFAGALYPELTGQKAAFMTPPQSPPPGSMGALGEKGVQMLTEFLQAVGEGKLDRASAIVVLEVTFGIPKKLGEKMVPAEPSEEDKNREAGLSPEGKHAPVVAGPKPAAKK